MYIQQNNTYYPFNHIQHTSLKLIPVGLNLSSIQIAIHAQELERNNIGVELHDNVNQLLATAKMMLDTARHAPEKLEICLTKSYAAIVLAIEEVRKLSHALVRPAFNKRNNFYDAIKDFADDITLSGKLDVKVNMSCSQELCHASESAKLTFYRIIQEQLNNILKYAQASSATVGITELPNSYKLVISDNGIGIDIEKKSTGIGLRNIANNVELHAGKFEIVSSPGEGCSLIIEIPF